MKATPSARLDFFWLTLFLAMVWLFAMTAGVWAADTASAPVDASSKLASIEKKLADSEAREKEILENQKTILAEIKKTQVWVRHR